MTPGVDAIAFDIDGTLYPDYRFYLRVLPHALANLSLMRAFSKARKALHHGGKSPPRAHCVAPNPQCGGPAPRNAPRRGAERPPGPPTSSADEFYRRQAELVAGYLKESPSDIGDKIQSCFYQTWQECFKSIKPFPRVRETIEQFRQSGFKTAVMSDFPIGDKLKFMRLDGLWDVELCTEELGALKPALKPFQALIRALQCPPESILYVGNSVRYDISGAKNAGMRTALIRRLPSFSGTGGADFVFRDYRQLKQFVLQETAPDVKRSSSHGGEKGEGRKEKKYCLR